MAFALTSQQAIGTEQERKKMFQVALYCGVTLPTGHHGTKALTILSLRFSSCKGARRSPPWDRERRSMGLSKKKVAVEAVTAFHAQMPTNGHRPPVARVTRTLPRRSWADSVQACQAWAGLCHPDMLRERTPQRPERPGSLACLCQSSGPAQS